MEMKLIQFTLLAACATVTSAAAIPRQPKMVEIESIRSLMRSLPVDPNGIFQLGPGHVLRSLDAKWEVLASVQLPPEVVAELKARREAV